MQRRPSRLLATVNKYIGRRETFADVIICLVVKVDSCWPSPAY